MKSSRVENEITLSASSKGKSTIGCGAAIRRVGWIKLVPFIQNESSQLGHGNETASAMG